MEQRTFSVLLIDNREEDYEATRRELYLSLTPDQFDFSLEWRRTLGQALKALAENVYDAILLDLSLPDSDGPESLKKIRSITSDTPIVILTAIDVGPLALRLVKEGAQDYIVKGKFPGTLYRSLIYAIQRQEILRRLAHSERQTRSSVLAKNAFFANMSHEIRNPLTSIIGYSEALMGSSLKGKDRERALSAIFSNGRHLLKLINDILDLSKIEADEIKIESSQESIAPFLRDLRQTFLQQGEKKGITFSLILEAPIPTKIETDLFRLRQVLYNLLGNAIKFTREGFVKLIVKTSVATDSLIFEIKDSGVGISEEGKKKLFKSFSQGDSGRTKEFGGTGLGLVISRQLTERLGGTLEFTSREGIGSIFTVSIPLGELGRSTLTTQPINFDEAPRAAHNTSALKITGRVLVADDLEDNRELISLLLRKVGLEVAVAEDGAVALDMVRKGSYDLLLLDMEMPRMGGQEVARTLRSQGSSIPIVAITAMMLEESQTECLEAGCDACLPKPFSQEDLYSCVLKFLGQAAQEMRTKTAPPTVKHDELDKVRMNFLRRLPARLDEIEQALESKDLDRLKGEAHRLIGSGLFGFQELSHFGGTLESLVIQEQVGGLGLMEALVKKVRNEISRISVEKNAAAAEGENPAEVSDQQSSTVLVFDDDDVNLKVVCRVLNVKGFIAAPARSLEDALRLCENESIALIVLSLEIGGTENFEFISQARKKLKRNIPVIAMTSLLPSEVRPKLSEFNVQYLLEKPVSRDKLLGTIDELIAANLSGENPAP